MQGHAIKSTDLALWSKQFSFFFFFSFFCKKLVAAEMYCHTLWNIDSQQMQSPVSAERAAPRP